MMTHSDKRHLLLEQESSQLWTRPFVIFMLINLSIFMAFDILLPKLSLYFQSKNFSDLQIGHVFAVFTLSSVSSRMLATRLSHHFKALNLIRVGLLVSVIATITYYLVSNVPSAMAIRFLQGAGFGLSSTLISSLASHVIPATRMGEGMGYLGLGTTLALAIGPFFGVWLVDISGGYFLLFAVAAIFYIFAIIFTKTLPPLELPRPKETGEKKHFVLISSKVAPVAILMLILGTILSSVIICMPLYCKEKNIPFAGYFFLMATAGIVLSRLSAGRIQDRLGHFYVIIPSSLLLTVSMLFLALAQNHAFFFWAAFLYGLSTGALFPCFQALLITAVTIEERTMAMASYYNAYEIGLGLGSLTIGYIAIHSGSYANVYLFSATAAFFIFLFYLILYRKRW